MLKQLFSVPPDDEVTGEQPDWPLWNHTLEHHGSRLRVIVGDLLAEAEDEFGGRGGMQFGAEVHLFQEDVPEFPVPGNPQARYDIHTFQLIVWRWGIYVSVRGRLY